MNPEALLDAEKNEAQLICVRIGPDLLPTGQQSFEPLEKGFGPFRSEIIKENFSWGADSNSEYVLFAARHIPRLYKYTYSPSGERSIHRFDAIRQEPYAGFAGCKASIAGQSISVDSRYVAALLVTEQNTKTIKLFDQARYTKDQHRDDAIMELQHQMLWDDSSIQQALHGLQFLPNNDLLLLNSENYAVGLMKAKNGRLGSITWGEPQDFTFNARFQPGLFDTNLSDKTLAVVDKACKSVILYDPSWNQVRRILPTLKTEEKISYIRIMSDSRLLLVGDSAGGVWEIEMPVL
jgi:hypothetical protein